MRRPIRSSDLVAALTVLLIGLPSAHADKLIFAPTTTDISVGHAAHSSLPVHSKCWQEAGLDVDVVGIQGSTAGLQQVAARNVSMAPIGPELVMLARAKGVKVKAVYTYSRSTIYRVVALKNSGITKIEDLRGKTMGVIAMSTGAVPYGRQMLQSVKIDPDKDVQWLPIGEGAQAALALKRGDAQAWFAWDTAVAALQAQGLEFVELRPSYFDDLIGTAIIVHEDFLAKNRPAVVKVLSCIAKATIFGLVNPEQTIRIHWQLYPTTRPEGDEATAMKRSRLVFDSRFGGYQKPANVKWGENVAAQWTGMAKLMQAEKLLPTDFDPASAYTNELIDEINAFDQAAVEQAARAAK